MKNIIQVAPTKQDKMQDFDEICCQTVVPAIASCSKTEKKTDISAFNIKLLQTTVL